MTEVLWYSAVQLVYQSSHTLGLSLSLSVEGMSEEELQEKALGVAKHALSGKSDLERAAVLHQHIGSRAMGDMVIETFEPSPGEGVQNAECSQSELKGNIVTIRNGSGLAHCQIGVCCK